MKPQARTKKEKKGLQKLEKVCEQLERQEGENLAGDKTGLPAQAESTLQNNYPDVSMEVSGRPGSPGYVMGDEQKVKDFDKELYRSMCVEPQFYSLVVDLSRDDFLIDEDHGARP